MYPLDLCIQNFVVNCCHIKYINVDLKAYTYTILQPSLAGPGRAGPARLTAAIVVGLTFRVYALTLNYRTYVTIHVWDNILGYSTLSVFYPRVG